MNTKRQPILYLHTNSTAKVTHATIMLSHTICHAINAHIKYTNIAIIRVILVFLNLIYSPLENGLSVSSIGAKTKITIPDHTSKIKEAANEMSIYFNSIKITKTCTIKNHIAYYPNESYTTFAKS